MKNWKYSFSLLLRRIAKRKDRVRLRPNRGFPVVLPSEVIPHASLRHLPTETCRSYQTLSTGIRQDRERLEGREARPRYCRRMPYLRRPRFTNSLFRPPLLLLIVCYFHSRIFIFLPAA